MLALNGAAWAGAPGAQALTVSSITDLRAQVQGLVQRGIEASGRAAQLNDAGQWGLPEGLQGDVWVSVHEKTLDAHTRQVEAKVRTSNLETAPASGSLRFVLRDLQPVWVSTVVLRQGAPLVCGQLRQELRVLRSNVSRWSGTCEGLAGWRVKRPIDAGDVLLSSDLAPQSAVSANQEAQASISVGAVRIEVRATALADGQVGQEIPIRLAGQSSVLKARVLAPGEVIVIKGL
ncbi:MAG: flagellar basal body P-ring formation chaperone FlgA [Aquabacterium sp.]|uniref:flagellar basal body P-ring formation chaperone FlgA n=1 Tax=Aquabacterium sp. TaxID=1872578 RepID=UPI002717B924|nr:flagellar basal body P-ring formation chaperone FlgA [Aquabacterium sp.]MDO9005745.1 flagellar basal body P-ring formation chaperone FlgA [Aquabacterium sp.]